MALTEPQRAQIAIHEEAPKNGLAGLKHWRQDMLAGLVVALVSVPLSLGIALASGVPPICGLTSEIIAGLVFPFLGGAYVTISGPAAGLAPVIYSSMLALGHGNLENGYRLITGVIMFAGLLQLFLTWAKAARFSYLFPSAAIQGMLSAIGFMLIAKQVPNFIGHPYNAHEFWSLIMETPAEVVKLQPQVFAISTISLALLFLVPRLKIRALNIVPPQLLVVIISVVLGLAWHLNPKFLVSVPDNVFSHGMAPPDFHALFSDMGLVCSIIVAVLTLTFVDGTESLATILAVDKIDPWHRKSSPNRTLFAMGISNICSSLIGGLTIIPGIIKSTTCIVSGGRTAWVNFYNAMFLIIFLVAASSMIKLIPLGALAAVLVHIGVKLAGPQKWKNMWSIGSEQFLVYCVTILVTVSSDLLLGILAGIILKFIMLVIYNSKARHGFDLSCITGLFKSPILLAREVDGQSLIQLAGPVVCFNSLALRAACEQALVRRKPVRVDILPSVNVVDHSSSSFLQTFQQACERAGIDFTITGMESLKARSAETTSLKFRAIPAAVPVAGIKMLLAIDDTEHSRNAIQEVIRTTWPAGSQLVVASVINAPFGMSVSAQHSDRLKQMVDNVVGLVKAENKSIERVEGIVLKGDAKTELYNLVRQRQSDLLVLGTRKHKDMSRMLLGSISHALLLSTHCSVRICRSQRSESGNKVMIAVDNSKFSMHALHQVAGRPWPENTQFICVSAIPTLSEYLYEVPDTYEIEDLERSRNRQIKSAQKVLDEATNLLSFDVPGSRVESRIIDGAPSEALIKLANEEKVDLIVLGSAGKNLAERLVVGSVSEAVAVWGKCSVEVICTTTKRTA